MVRIFLIHGWEGNPENHWFSWLRQECEMQGYTVIVPAMPSADHPKREAWVKYLSEAIGMPDESTYLVGHSLGCVTILNYLSLLPRQSRIGGAIFVAGFTSSLNIPEIENFVSGTIDASKIRTICPVIIALASTNDSYVPETEGKVLRDQFGAKLEMIPNAGHFGTSDGYQKFPVLLEKLNLLIEEKS